MQSYAVDLRNIWESKLTKSPDRMLDVEFAGSAELPLVPLHVTFTLLFDWICARTWLGRIAGNMIVLYVIMR